MTPRNEGDIILFRNIPHTISNHGLMRLTGRFEIVAALNTKKHYIPCTSQMVQGLSYFLLPRGCRKKIGSELIKFAEERTKETVDI